MGCEIPHIEELVPEYLGVKCFYLSLPSENELIGYIKCIEVIVELNKNGTIKKIIEKPVFTKSNLVITGLYAFDSNVVSYINNLKPSLRNELEIVDLINIYKRKKKLNLIKLGRGTAWMDVGSYEDLYSASRIKKNIEDRQNYKIGCLEEISFNNKWITKKNILNRIKFNKNSNYSKYLETLIIQ